MEMKPHICSGCGAPLAAPDAAGLAECGFCGLRSSAPRPSHTAVARPSAESTEVRQLKLEQALKRFDREFAETRESRIEQLGAARTTASAGQGIVLLLLGPVVGWLTVAITGNSFAAVAVAIVGLTLGIIAFRSRTT